MKNIKLVVLVVSIVIWFGGKIKQLKLVEYNRELVVNFFAYAAISGFKR